MPSPQPFVALVSTFGPLERDSFITYVRNENGTFNFSNRIVELQQEVT